MTTRAITEEELERWAHEPMIDRRRVGNHVEEVFKDLIVVLDGGPTTFFVVGVKINQPPKARESIRTTIAELLKREGL